jgi:hypothetical protein
MPGSTEAREVFEPPGRAQRFWMRALPCLLSPHDGRGHSLSRATNMVLVVPLTLLTPMTLSYQAYLNRIFHRRLPAKIGHGAFIPVTTWLIMVAASSIFGARPEGHALTLANLTMFNGAAAVALVLGVYYFAWAILERALVWGAALVALVAGFWLLANAQFTLTHADAPNAPFYAAWRTFHNPYIWMAITSLCQALSHIPEPELPPRLNGLPDWMPIRDYLFGSPSVHEDDGTVRKLSLSGRVARMAGHFLFGPMDEWLAAGRLFPVYVLELLWALGYQRARREAIHALADRSIAEGNPALDWIGTGGGRFLFKGPPA